MDFCPECGLAVDVRRREDEAVVYVCRNPQCPRYGQVLQETPLKPNSPTEGGPFNG